MRSESNSDNYRYKSICLRVKPEEYQDILQQAERMNLSINSYGKKRLLDSSDNDRTQLDYIMRLIPDIYTKIDQIEDVSIRKMLKEEVSRICQCLK